MREFKFRVWDKLTKTIQMVATIDFNNSIIDTYGVNEPIYNLNFDDLVLMQYTGLKDINGKDIYEGDLVIDFMKNIKIVKFGKYQGFLYDDYLNYGYYLEELRNKNYVHPCIITDMQTIIGNIYENPELLNNVNIEE